MLAVNAGAADDNLPSLEAPNAAFSQTRVHPSARGLDIDSNDADSRFSINTETSQRTGASVGLRGALTLGDAAALGGGAQLGGNGSEVFLNLGIGLGRAQRLMLTGGQLRQKLEFAFPSGTTRAEMTQNSAGASWRLSLGNGLFDYADATAYTARTASRDLGAINYTVDTVTLYELWRDPRRIAGSTLDGLQGKLGLRPWEGGRANVGFGQERLRYDLLNGDERHTRATGSLGLEQALGGNTRLKFGVDAAAAQGRSTVGFDTRIGDLGTLGIEFVNIRGRDGAPNDRRVQVSWTLPLGRASAASAMAAPTGLSARNAGNPAIDDRRMPAAREVQPETQRSGSDGLLDQVAARPTWMPSQVVAKLDTSAAPMRLIAVDKTALPAGSNVDTATGIITTPLGVAVLSIAGVTKNGGAFANGGQFTLSGNSLVVNPNLITQPAVGVIDVYVVTANNAGGGTTLITINVSHGSVKLDSIVVTNGAPAPAAPTASAVSITGTAQVGQLLTGHYTYADANGDPQGVSTFRWLRNGVAIAGATASTYMLAIADAGNTITFEVAPVATVAPTTGIPVVSSPTAVVLGRYVSQGGLTWMPVSTTEYYYAQAAALCAGTINGQTGWRLPTANELVSLYNSGAMNGQGWLLTINWSSTPTPGYANYHDGVVLTNVGNLAGHGGQVVGYPESSYQLGVSCVR